MIIIPSFPIYKKNYSQPETAYVTRGSVVLLVFTHFCIGKVIVKYPFRENAPRNNQGNSLTTFWYVSTN